MTDRYLTIAVQDQIESRSTTILEDKFKYCPDRGWKWLQRVCLWVLRKLKCNATEIHVTYDTITVDQTAIPETALRQIDKIRRRGQTPEFILAGPAEWSLIMNSDVMSSSIEFNISYCHASSPWNRRLYDLPRPYYT